MANRALIFHRIAGKQILSHEDVYETELSFILDSIHKSCSSLEEINDLNHEANSWLLTFDDGFSSDFERVLPILTSLNIKALFFITTSYVGKPNYMTWDQIKILSDCGMEIGSHSVSHQDMLSIEKSERIYELVQSKKIIEDQIGKEIKAFSFPFGRYNAKLANEVFEMGYGYCFTSNPGSFNQKDKLLPRIAINGSMERDQIIKIINRDLIEYMKSFIMYNLLDLAKYCMGIENYWRIRAYLHNQKKIIDYFKV